MTKQLFAAVHKSVASFTLFNSSAAKTNVRLLPFTVDAVANPTETGASKSAAVPTKTTFVRSRVVAFTGSLNSSVILPSSRSNTNLSNSGCLLSGTNVVASVIVVATTGTSAMSWIPPLASFTVVVSLLIATPVFNLSTLVAASDSVMVTDVSMTLDVVLSSSSCTTADAVPSKKVTAESCRVLGFTASKN